MNQRFKRLAAWFIAAALTTSIAPTGFIANAATAPGTQITNNASATYKDAAGNSYTTTSNTVTTTVQNAPTLTLTPGTGTNYAPAQTVTDTFTLVNTGNATGSFQVSGAASAPTSTSDAVIGGSDASYATLGNGAATCNTPAGSQSAPCKYAVTIGGTTYYFTSLDATSTNTSLDYYLANNAGAQTAAGGSIVVSVYYTMSPSATTGNTVSSQIFGSVAYAAAGSAPAELSAYQTGTETNNINSDARLDMYKASSQNATTGDITYTISSHNGGAFSAKDLQSVKALIGGSAPVGVLLSDKIPLFAGSPLNISNSGQVSVTTNATYGYATGASAKVYYTTNSAGTGGWTLATGSSSPYTIPTTGVYYIAVLISGGSCSGTSGFELCADTGHPTNPGNANVATYPAVQFSFVVQQPSGPGAGNSGSVTNLANGVIGDNQPTEHILGANIPTGTADSASSTALTTTNQGINNTTQTSNNGDSNQVSNAALQAFNALNGPLGQPQSSGTYDGSVANNTNDDFTAFPFGQAGDNVTNTSTTVGSPTTTVTTSAAQTICVAHTLQNSGNKNDSYNIVANVPTAYQVPTTTGGSSIGTTWKVGVYSDSACSSALGGAVDGTSSSTAANVALNSGVNLNYYVKYIIPSGTKYFYRFDAQIVATSVGDATKSNNTHDELYSGFVALTKSQTVSSNGCPAGVTPSYVAGTICPTGVLQYSIDYRSLVMGTSDTNVSFNSAVSQAGSLAITDDGTQSTTSQTTTPNWASFAVMVAAPSDTTSGTTYTYGTGIPASGSSSTFSTTDTKWVGTVGGASGQIVPANYLTPTASQKTSGQITFSVTVQ